MARKETPHTYQGISASPGISRGPIFVYQEQDLSVPRHQIKDSEDEIRRLEKAIAIADEQITSLQTKAETETGTEEAAIFEAHALFLQDPTLINAVHESIQGQKLNAEAAWIDAVEVNASNLEALEDEYFQARAADVRDVGRRVLRILLGVAESDLSDLTAPSIVLARDLTPSDTVRLDKSLVLGFCTAEGGPTSHTAILAKALGLPAVVGLGNSILDLKSGDPLLIDGGRGEVIAFPDEKIIQEFDVRRQKLEAQALAELELAHEPAITVDGHQVEIVANIGSPQEAQSALKHGAEGIGLLRTEFLYLDRHEEPNEEEQLAAFDSILDAMEERPVVVRTIDVGGDKEVPYLDLGVEANPFLGWRAIRMSLDKPELFKTQLRALWRASPGHDLRVMFPMIATLDEVRRAQKLFKDAREEVVAEGHGVADRVQVGIMVEVPSVAVLADLFAREVDFFSIGTNDLTQYTFAAERTNEKVAHLGDGCHPAVLRQIQRVINAAHDEGIWVGLCGELAGDPDAAPILLGLGLDEFSMAPSSIPHAKAIIRNWSKSDAQKLASKALEFDSAEAVREYVRTNQPG
ncbi:MAG: phosphoenolpyruvate--protein phosphotransferase [Anaerolineaceae bacterium]|nr:MAG: phosphoenolpyruvate--protein phosphotransferase [Anaerolineaceae bacterium]